MEKQTIDLDVKQTYLENIRKRVEESNVYMLNLLLESDQLKKFEIDPSSKEIIEAHKILSSLQHERDTFINSLKAYFINEKFWNYLEQTSYTSLDGPLTKAIYVYLQKLHDTNKKFDKVKQLEYVKQNTICNIMYWVLSRKLDKFTEIYPSYSLSQLKDTLDRDPTFFDDYTSGDNFLDHWENKPKEWMLNADGKIHKRENIDFNTRRNAHWGSAGEVNADAKLKIGRNNKPTKLGNPDTLREELYCHYYKFWNHRINTRCFHNKKCVENCIFGYLGRESLKRLSQHLTLEKCPFQYPLRTYPNLVTSTDSGNALQQAIDSINYLLGYYDVSDAKYQKLPDGSTNLETLVNTIANDNNINIYILDATNACDEVSIEWGSDEIVKGVNKQSNYSETIFIYVYRGIKGIEFVEPIVFIPLNKDGVIQLVKKISNQDAIVQNLNDELPECGISVPEQPLSKTPILTNYQTVMTTDTVTDSIATPPSKHEGNQQMAYYNTNDIGQALPIVEIGIDRTKYLLGNEYLIDHDQTNYRNLYGQMYPYNLMGRLSGDVHTTRVMISWLKSDNKKEDNPDDTSEKSESVVKPLSGGGCDNNIYECLTKNSSVKSTPFYSILESSIY